MMSAYGNSPYYPNQSSYIPATWDVNAMANPYTGTPDARYINTHPSILEEHIDEAPVVPMEPNPTMYGLLPVNHSTPWINDVAKWGILFLGGGVILSLLSYPDPKKSTHSAEAFWKWLKNPIAKKFEDDQGKLTAKWMLGLQGPDGKTKQANLSRRMQAEGGTHYIQNLMNYYDEYGGNVYKRARMAKHLEEKREQGVDVVLLHRELLRDPKDKRYKKDFYKDYGFKTQGEAVQQTQMVVRALLENFRKAGRHQNEKVQTLTNMSENFLEMYVERHSADARNYPMGNGMSRLARLVYLPKMRTLIKEKKQGEAERALRQFLHIASQEPHDYSGDTATVPTRLFTFDEWKTFLHEYRDIMRHKIQRNTLNRQLLQGINDFAYHGSAAFNQNGKYKQEAKLRKSLDILKKQSRDFSPHVNVGQISNEINGKKVTSLGQTFNLLHELLKKHHPQIDYLSTVDDVA
ncbi:MAG: hypothetical protein HEQ32_03010 [Vampirovibrio sp.]